MLCLELCLGMKQDLERRERRQERRVGKGRRAEKRARRGYEIRVQSRSSGSWPVVQTCGPVWMVSAGPLVSWAMIEPNCVQVCVLHPNVTTGCEPGQMHGVDQGSAPLDCSHAKLQNSREMEYPHSKRKALESPGGTFRSLYLSLYIFIFLSPPLSLYPSLCFSWSVPLVH